MVSEICCFLILLRVSRAWCRSTCAWPHFWRKKQSNKMFISLAERVGFAREPWEASVLQERKQQEERMGNLLQVGFNMLALLPAKVDQVSVLYVKFKIGARRERLPQWSHCLKTVFQLLLFSLKLICWLFFVKLKAWLSNNVHGLLPSVLHSGEF